MKDLLPGTCSVDPLTIRGFFDSIALRYDKLNCFLSFRLDEGWRRRACEIVLNGSEESVLDLGVGTGKFVSSALRKQPQVRAVGLDLSSRMMELARKNLPQNVKFVNADFQSLPFKHGSFDLVLSAFTLRSVQNMEVFLRGVLGLLKEQGKAAFLCLTRPRHFFWKLFYLPYMKFYLPWIGGLFSGSREAYQFLSSSVLHFQEPEATMALMRQAGFSDVRSFRFSLGLATLLVGSREKG